MYLYKIEMKFNSKKYGKKYEKCIKTMAYLMQNENRKKNWFSVAYYVIEIIYREIFCKWINDLCRLITKEVIKINNLQYRGTRIRPTENFLSDYTTFLLFHKEMSYLPMEC